MATGSRTIRSVQASKSTTVRTDSGLLLTKHEYIEVEAAGVRNQPVLTQSVQTGSIVYGSERELIPIRQTSVDDDDMPTCLVCCALLMAFLSFGSILCGIPAAILACKALTSCDDDPETSRGNAKRSICCSIFGIAVLIVAIIGWSTDD